MSERRLTPEFREFLAESRMDSPFDDPVFCSPRWLQRIVERRLPLLVSDGYHKMKEAATSTGDIR